MKKVIEFYIEESKVNKGMEILVAVTTYGEKFVIGGDHYNPTAAVPYVKCWDALGEKEFKKLSNGGK